MTNPGGGAEHIVSFYRNHACIVDQVTAFTREGLAERERVIVVATPSHWDTVAARLDQTGVDHGRATAEGRLIVIDAEDVLERITVDGEISVPLFREMVGRLLSPAGKTRIYGEVVSLLAERGDVEDSMTLEAVGHELSETLGVRIMCGYQVQPALTPIVVRRIEVRHDRSVFEAAGKRPARLRPLP
jgi:MEDS: MEthanogen/methylotroph, DcmR Sensory domain